MMLFSRIAYQSITTKYVAFRSEQLPTFYDVNVSLYSNLTKVSTMQHLFELHSKMHKYYNSKHIAFTTRQLIKFIAQHQKKANLRQPYVPKQNIAEWEILLKSIFGLQIESLSSQQMVDVVHFLYKTIYFKIPFQEMFPSLQGSRRICRQNVIREITNPNRLKQLPMTELTSLLFDLSMIVPKSTKPVLQQLKILLHQNPYYTCFHLILMFKGLTSVASKISQSENQQIIKQIQEIGVKMLMQEHPIYKNYISHLTMIQIYNITRKSNPDFASEILLEIRQKLKISSQKIKIYQPLFNKELELFQFNLRQEIQRNPNDEVVKNQLKHLQLQKIGSSKYRKKQ